MLRLSNFPIKTLKSAPKVSDNRSTSLLLQAWFIRQEMAWVYNYLPLWLKVLKKIEQIIREEMNSIWAYELFMPSLLKKESWLKTGRWDTVDVLFKFKWSGWKEYWLNPTHEEVITPLMWEFIKSYKDLDNMKVYQFQNKFRNEPRAKSWLLRWREFLMKDLYSFHRNESDLDEFFEEVRKAYTRVFDRVWIWKDTFYTFASWWSFSKYSYEFQTKLDIWEDDIYVCKNCWQAHNDEIVSEIFECVNCKKWDYEVIKTSEVWNIFKLGTKFSNAFWIKYIDEFGNSRDVFMWCYGIGVSRLMWVIAEYFMDEKWLVWPENIAPANYYIIVMWNNLDKALNLASEIESKWWEVIIDDREKVGFGQKAGDSDLMWIPNRIVISDRTLALWWYELKKRLDDTIKIVNF